VAAPKMLEDDRKRAGWSVGQAAWRLGVSPRAYRELEAGARFPNWETFDRICKLFGWPVTFAVGATRSGLEWACGRVSANA
jgi:DNA-binding XRE family transcriptional regulator